MRIEKCLLLLLITVLCLSGCVSYVQMPDIALEQKNYPKPEDVSNLSFAMAQPEIKVTTNLTNTTTSGLFERVKYDTNKVSGYLTKEVQKVLLSKGFTITNTYESYNNMTFTQKRNTSALFYPQVDIQIDEKSLWEHMRFLVFSNTSIKGRINVNATVNIIMLEPLSGEKLWIKSIPITGLDESVLYSPELYGGPELTGSYVPEELKPIAVKIDSMYQLIALEIVNATKKYVERNEFEFLNSDISKLKGIKRY